MGRARGEKEEEEEEAAEERGASREVQTSPVHAAPVTSLKVRASATPPLH